MYRYLITDPIYYGNVSSSVSDKLKTVSQKRYFDFACLRDKTSSNYENLTKEFILTCKDLNVKPILHNHVELSIKYSSFGVHLSSDNFYKIKEAKQNNLFVISSTHTIDEAMNATNLGSDMITISPIFNSPNKSKPIGLEKLKEITDKIPNRCIALGGILDDSQILACKRVGAIGFASIRYFI